MSDTPQRDDRWTRKRRRDDLHADAVLLAERLATVRDEWLVGLDYGDDELAEALALARRLKASGAKNRQVRHVARLLLQVDEEPIKAHLDACEAGHGDDVALLHAGEQWRDRIVAEGAEAIEAFIAEFPAAEPQRQHLRQLARQAAKDVAAGKPARSRRTIYRTLKPFLADDGEGAEGDEDEVDDAEP
ncbi:MAG: DUF615 domain-containing protein [Myxococcales bacterium]|nr:DUF615 domain-containing protein [Myxococcales bacterium]